MFSAELEKRWRGKLFVRKVPEDIVEAHIATRRSSRIPKNEVSTRAITRQWPRDPKGPMITSLPAGKKTPSSWPLWGATLFDFFHVDRAPGYGGRTIANSSRLLAWAKEVGELKHAEDEIAWAEEEESPKELFPYDMACLLSDEDYMGHMTKEPRDEYHRLPNGKMSARRYQIFQNRLPLHLLPEKLIVHDPDNTLCVGERSKVKSGECNAPRVYKLELTKEARAAIDAERRKPTDFLGDALSDNSAHTSKPNEANVRNVQEDEALELTMVELPPPPPSLLSTPDAHLYINAADKLGEGHHSQVYRVTWEIPRSLVIKPYLCDRCIDEGLFNKLREEAPDAMISAEKPLDVQLEELMRHSASLHGRKGKLTTTVEVTTPEVDVEVVYGKNGENSETFTKPGEGSVTLEYEGSIRTVNTGLKWSTSGNFCKHEEHRKKAPSTFKVEVTAKLSIMGDEHLQREAKNYQKFPEHFFQNWSGYNLVYPNCDPTPALAVVPQFYGYYVPEDGQVEDGEYLSPILLLENCGMPVNMDDLSYDDRTECAALLFRMHTEGWLHNSFFPRNVLMQCGDISQWPAFRRVEDRRFRIIDFGRSAQYPKEVRETQEYQIAVCHEQRECKKTFQISSY